MSLEAVPRQVTWLIILKATVKATPSDASGQGSTIQSLRITYMNMWRTGLWSPAGLVAIIEPMVDRARSLK